MTTRFYLTAGAEKFEVLRVTETRNGDLILNRRNCQVGPEGKVGLSTQRRITVHRSLRSKTGGNGITYNTDYSDGRRFRQVSFIETQDSPLLWPIFAQRCEVLTAEHNILRKKPTEKTIEAGIFNPTFETPFLFPFVAEAGLHNSLGDLARYAVVAKFKYFDVILVVGYCPTIFENSGDTIYHFTSSAAVDGMIVYEPPSDVTRKTVPIADMEAVIGRATKQLIDGVCQKLSFRGINILPNIPFAFRPVRVIQ